MIKMSKLIEASNSADSVYDDMTIVLDKLRIVYKFLKENQGYGYMKNRDFDDFLENYALIMSSIKKAATGVSKMNSK